MLRVKLELPESKLRLFARRPAFVFLIVHVQLVRTSGTRHQQKAPHPGTYTAMFSAYLPPTRHSRRRRRCRRPELQLAGTSAWALKTNYLLTSAKSGPDSLLSNTRLPSRPGKRRPTGVFCRLNIDQTSLCLSGTCNPNNERRAAGCRYRSEAAGYAIYRSA